MVTASIAARGCHVLRYIEQDLRNKESCPKQAEDPHVTNLLLFHLAAPHHVGLFNLSGRSVSDIQIHTLPKKISKFSCILVALSMGHITAQPRPGWDLVLEIGPSGLQRGGFIRVENL